MSIAAWADFLDARARLIHEWMRDGIPGNPRSRDNATAIAVHLNHHDAVQIKLISMTPLYPPQPCTSRLALERIMAALRAEDTPEATIANITGIMHEAAG